MGITPILKVCHIASGDLWAGAEVMVHRLLNSLNEYNRIKLCAILLNNGRLASELDKLGINIYILDEKKMSFFHIISSIRSIISKEHPDILHAHRYKENILSYICSRNKRPTCLISTQHGLQELPTNSMTIGHRVAIEVNSLVLSTAFDHIVTVSQNVRSKLTTQYLFKQNSITVIHNGSDIPLKNQERQNQTPFIIGACGRFCPVKDFPLLIEIAKAVLCNVPTVRFEIAGAGPYMDKIQHSINMYKLNTQVTLLGHITDMKPFYDRLSLFINTSLYEGIPMSILESMAHGIPVIAPNVGGLPEIIKNGVHGFLVDSRRPKGFAEKCLLLHENNSLWRQMSNAARARIEQTFSVRKMAAEYYNLYLNSCRSQ